MHKDITRLRESIITRDRVIRAMLPFYKKLYQEDIKNDKYIELLGRVRQNIKILTMIEDIINDF